MCAHMNFDGVPYYLAAMRNGGVIASFGYEHVVRVIRAGGSVVQTLGVRNTRRCGSNRFNHPCGVPLMLHDNALVIAADLDNRVCLFTRKCHGGHFMFACAL